MLEKVRLHGFQKHRDLTIDFDSKITTIVGSSDVGKSSVIRALRWALRLGPATMPAPVKGDGEARVTVVLDGRVLTRTKGDENAYTLDGAEFKAFRSTMPEPIADFLSLADVNFQNQHDNSFWLSDSSGEVSRQLNQLVNLEIIDETLSRASSAVRAASSASVNAEDVFKEGWRVYRESSKSRGILKDFERLEKAEDKSEEKETSFWKLVDAVKTALTAREDLRRTKDRFADAEQVLEKALKATEKSETAKDTRLALGLFKEAKKNLKISKKCLEDGTSVQKAASKLGKIQSTVLPLSNVIKTGKEASLYLKEMRGLPSLENIENTLRKIVGLKSKIMVLRTDVKEVKVRSDIIERAKKLNFSEIQSTFENICSLKQQIAALEVAKKAAKTALIRLDSTKVELLSEKKELEQWKTCSECGKPL